MTSYLKQIDIKRFFVYVIQFLLAIVFFYSAIAKIESMQSFELFIFQFKAFSWSLTSLIARFIIIMELILGFLFLLNYKTKGIIKGALGMMAIFTLFLVYLHFFKGQEENCHCFGEFIELDPLESIIKNIFIIGFLFFVYKNPYPFKKAWLKYLQIYGSVLILIVIFIINAPDFILLKIYDQDRDVDISKNFKKLEQYFPGTGYQNQSKKIVAFFSANCKYCQMAGEKLSVFRQQSDEERPVYLVFVGKEDHISSFIEDTKLHDYPYAIVESKTFFSYTGPRFPVIFFIKDGDAIFKRHYGNLMDSEFKRFFENN